MKWDNETTVNEFILLAFSSLGHLQILLFFVFLLVYLMTVMGNLLIILTIILNSTLHSPMYFFLQILSFAEVGFTSTIVPKLLVNLLSEKKTISLSGCRAQIYFIFFFGSMECFILIVMAYDRFVAICNPLHYAVIMNKKFCMLLVAIVWVLVIPIATIQSTWLLSFPFCKSNTISHFFCDTPPILQLACLDTSRFEIFTLIETFILFLCPFMLILVSYIHIISTILGMTSVERRRKAFSTCSSHIIVVTLFYVSAGLTHFHPKSSYGPANRHLLSLSYVVFTPLLNPLIYSLRNKEVKGALTRFIKRKMHCCE
ncbi:olfactory receptor 10A2-like [Sceloporus undulatus]|uniref:olfactory receptor 10A2-like n=1 Tax=Sceloporus undulatus TaxID=8520 RepID=UPI001C4C05ED|nr:olfactory receptor 10A2-like [Sceloporus undulatus]